MNRNSEGMVLIHTHNSQRRGRTMAMSTIINIGSSSRFRRCYVRSGKSKSSLPDSEHDPALQKPEAACFTEGVPASNGIRGIPSTSVAYNFPLLRHPLAAIRPSNQEISLLRLLKLLATTIKKLLFLCYCAGEF